MSEDAERRKSASSIHFLWIIAVLLLIISAQIMYAPSGNIIRDYVSFASAIASILLALVAIFQSLLSGQSLSTSLIKIQESAADIRKESDDLRGTSEKFISIIDNAIKKIDLVPTAVLDMSSALSEKMDAMSQPVLKKTGKPETGIDLFSSSVGAAVSLYLLIQAYEKRIEFSPKDVFSESKIFQNNSLGFFQAVRLFKPYGIDIEMIKESIFIKSLGEIDSAGLVDIIHKNDNTTAKKYADIVDKFIEERESIRTGKGNGIEDEEKE